MAEKPQHNPLLHRLRVWAATEALGKLTDRELLRRYAKTRDEQAFQVVMERHGPMVLRACRRFLGNQQDAEDAFQATFFVLARKAGLRRWEQSVANWLYSVACCVSRTARRASARRKSYEQRSPSKATGTPQEELSAREFMAVFDEELSQLPDKYRAVLVQVYLEGKPQDEAARALGLSLDMVKKRLQRGRGLLEVRLTRRGLSLSVALTAILVSEKAATAVVPTALASGTLWAVRLYEAGQAAVGAKSAAHALATAVLHNMMVGYARSLVIVTGVLLLVAGGSAIGWRTAASRPEALAPLVSASGESLIVSPKGDEISRRKMEPPTKPIAGRVFDAAGRPVPHAAIAALARRPFRPGQYGLHDDVLRRGHADAEGRFRLAVPADFPTLYAERRIDPKGDFRQMVPADFPTWYAERSVALIASSPGHAPGTLTVPLEDGAGNIDLRLTVPRGVRGRLIDVDGKPAAGVTVHVARLGTVAREPIQGEEAASLPAPVAVPGWPAVARTDEAGYFQIDGIDPAVPVWLEIADDRFAGELFPVPANASDTPFTHTLAPGQLLEGRVQEVATGRPVADARVSVMTYAHGIPPNYARSTRAAIADRSLRSPSYDVDARTDAAGRFRLRARLGTHLCTFLCLEVQPPPGMSCLAVRRFVDWPQGKTRLEVTLPLPPGVVVRGTVREGEDDRPVPGAALLFMPWGPLPRSKDEAILTNQETYVHSDTQGRFQITVPSVPGHLLAYGPTDDYRPRVLPDRDGFEPPVEAHRFYAHGLAALDAVAWDTAQDLTIRLRRGERVSGTVVGPHGEPVKEAALVQSERISAVGTVTVRPLPVRDSRFTLPGCAPDRLYPALFLDIANKWGAAVDLPGRGEGIRVQLAPCGAATLRLVDETGQPLAGRGVDLILFTERSLPQGAEKGERCAEGHLAFWCDPINYGAPLTTTGADGLPHSQVLAPGIRYVRPLTTGADGVVHFPVLIPGARYRAVYASRDGTVATAKFSVQPGQKLTLPDLVVQLPKGE